MFNLTPIVRNLILINSGVFILQLFIPEVTGYLSLYNVNTSFFKPYQLFTYMFAHGGFMHLFFNMLMLAFTAPVLETFWGSNRFLQFYLITGVGAAVFNVLIDLLTGGGAGAMLGASGAIYGVLMGFGMLFPNLEVMLLIPPIPVKAKYLVFVLGGLTFLMDRSGSVAHLAHLGGIVVAWILIKFWRSKGTYW
ncbi:MAG: rhomboid family intramembrane serine protease [Cyclobacteriaceae bacterium]|nr:rhomboid family intramembrane serine protease [Cyclobacteriaceae bacterium]MCX7637301.1 rhomboid family intramembrane serine protease [Cyclobacteriaceae bacterium]MDW8331120.1 rhomboid family intramembrane serine protease [Cyclobacteriaceae bacterium]